MSDNQDITRQLRRELDETRQRLAEAEETINAIRNGEVDGLMVAGSKGQQVFMLQGALEPYRLLIEQMSEGALTLSRDGTILYANQTFAAMLQLPPGRVIGTALRDFLSAADQPALAGLISTALNGSSVGEVSLRTAVGSTSTLRLGLHRLQLGAEILICAVATDITVEKQRKTESRRLAELLEARISERTTDLTVSRLSIMSMMEEEVESRRAMEMANRDLTQQITERQRAEAEARQTALELQAKNAELERFLYTTSHDLKSPVVTIRTFIGYLEQDLAEANAGRITKDINFIRDAADKLWLLLNSVLEIGRIGHVIALPTRITFRQLADDALAAVAGQISNGGVTVQVGDGNLVLFGDRVRLAEVFQNLLDNACKFMGGQPAPRIEIGFAVHATETVFFVRDNGIGIDPRHQAKLFGLFERLNPKTEGSGIGLAISKRIVELNQGRIWLESAGTGQGAGFYFTLPAAIKNKKKEKNDER